MKRVLVLSYCFPPMPEAGALRGSFLARYLPYYGWKPTIVALACHGQHPPDVDAIYVVNPFSRSSRRLLRAAPAAAAASPRQATSLARGAYRRLSNAQFPDAAMGWIVPAYRAAARRLSLQPHAAVLSSAYPFSSHVIAYALARRFHLPWIADYRDLWSGNPYCTDSPARQNMTHRFEQHLMRRAGRLTTVSASLVDELRTIHRRDDVIAISNGTSHEEWADIPLVAPHDFNILFAGNLYAGLRSPDTLFAAAAALRAAGDPAGQAVRFDFYTPDAAIVAESARRHGITDAVRAHAVIPRTDLLRRQRQAAGLAIVLRDAAHLVSEIGSKIFEYLGAGRPIIATGPRGSELADLLERGGAGYFAHDADAAAIALRKMHAEFAAGRFNIQLKPGFRPFTAFELAERFAAQLDTLTVQT